MRNSLSCLQRIGVLTGLIFASVVIAWAQGAPPNMEGKTAEQFYKNIKAMNGTPADQLIESMHLIRGALGVDCEFCHDDPDRSTDTKKPKEVARDMIRMVVAINKNNFNGGQEVTCYTCHRGNAIPATTLVLPNVPKDVETDAQLQLPSVDQIVAKYVQALGGEQALRKVTTRVITGTQTVPTGPGGTVPMPAALERSQKAPAQVLFHRDR